MMVFAGFMDVPALDFREANDLQDRSPEKG